MKKILSAFALVLSVCHVAFAESSVWKAQKGSAVVYLGGTCHILRESDYPLPPEFERAYRASDILVFETDIATLKAPATQARFLAKAVYADGSTVDKHLSAKAYAKLDSFCEANGIPLQAFSQFRPAMIMTTLTLLELTKMGATQEGVDSFFYQRAQKDNKRVEGLESADQQIDFLLSMADGEEDAFVDYSIEDLKTMREQFDQLADAWRRGDQGKLVELMVTELKVRQPKLYRKLITDRNREWLPVISAYKMTPKTRFVLVGVGHLVGPDGIIAALRAKGYRVDQIGAGR